MRPKILTSGILKIENYIAAIENAGGEAIVAQEYAQAYDGLVLCGGVDIDPSYYGEPIAGSKNINKELDELEFALLKAFAEAGKPVLGICRGCQLINIFFGGSLHQDIENAVEHASGVVGCDLVHNVTAQKGSIISNLYGERFSVNSSHHQAVKKLGEDLKITMRTEDGKVVEGIEHNTLPIIAVQWHPERMCGAHSREDTVDGSKIFEHFISLCKARMR